MDGFDDFPDPTKRCCDPPDKSFEKLKYPLVNG